MFGGQRQNTLLCHRTLNIVILKNHILLQYLQKKHTHRVILFLSKILQVGPLKELVCSQQESYQTDPSKNSIVTYLQTKLRNPSAQ